MTNSRSVWARLVCPFSSNRNQAVAASESHTLKIQFGVSEFSMVSKCEAPTWQGSVNTFTPKQRQLNQRASKCIRRCWKIGSEGPLCSCVGRMPDAFSLPQALPSAAMEVKGGLQSSLMTAVHSEIKNVLLPCAVYCQKGFKRGICQRYCAATLAAPGCRRPGKLPLRRAKPCKMAAQACDRPRSSLYSRRCMNA